MATKDKVILYAKACANRRKEDVAIYQSKNGQWLYAPISSPELLFRTKLEIIKPDK